VTSFNYKQVALRENEDFQDSVRLSTTKVSIKSTSMTQITREYTVCLQLNKLSIIYRIFQV